MFTFLNHNITSAQFDDHGSFSFSLQLNTNIGKRPEYTHNIALTDNRENFEPVNVEQNISIPENI